MTAIQLTAIWIYIGSGLIDLPAGVDLHLTPGLAALLFLLYLPVAALIASVLLLASAYSKSYKEAQLYFLPAFVLGIAPTLAAMIPGREPAVGAGPGADREHQSWRSRTSWPARPIR